jgi:phosphomannomutase
MTPEVVTRYASAFARYCVQRHGTGSEVVIGRDGRITGEPLAGILAGALRMTGVSVRDLGICPTPTVQLAVEHGHAAGGISVTASHNPMQWNGMKFVAPTGMFLNARENRELWNLADISPVHAPWDRFGGYCRDTGWLEKHKQAVLGLPAVDAGRIRRRRFRVVVDCINASGGVVVPHLLRELGCEVVEMNCDVSGIFARTPEPIPENLTAVSERVRREGADLGVVVDPDADRLVLVTETGDPLGEEYTVTAAIRFVLESRGSAASGDTVVVNLSTTRAVDDVARAAGARVIRTPVGEINVAERMKETGAVVGGEGSGGVILPAVHLGRDAIVGIGLILQLLADHGGTLSSLKASLPSYAITKGKVDLGARSGDEILARIQEAHGTRGSVNTDDGLKIDFPDSWVHLRKSNTEPIVRIIAEAPTMDRAAALVAEYRRDIDRILES